MKFVYRLAMWATVTACLALVAPMVPTTAAADSKAGHTTHQNASSPAAHSSTAAPASPSTSADTRDIWLKRAQSSEFILGKASYYSTDLHNGPTASGVGYDMYTFTAAHRTLPIGTVVRVTDQQNGKSDMVCVTDRGPFIRGRIIDLSYAAADQIDMRRRGVGKVSLEVVSDAQGRPLADDLAYFVRFRGMETSEMVGPFRAFADAAAMHEAMRQAHPDAEVILEKAQ